MKLNKPLLREENGKQYYSAIEYAKDWADKTESPWYDVNIPDPEAAEQLARRGIRELLAERRNLKAGIRELILQTDEVLTAAEREAARQMVREQIKENRKKNEKAAQEHKKQIRSRS